MISAAQFPLAFILLAHDNWPHLQQLVKYFAADPADTLVIHIDGRVPNVVFERVKQQLGRPNVLFSNRLKCHWGHFSLVEATLAGIQTLAASGRPFRYASLLSGVDYPIKPQARLRRFLAECGDQEFIEAYNMYFERWVISGSYTERYEYIYPFGRYVYHQKLFRLWELFQAKRDRRRSMPKGLVPFSGSQWWTLTSQAIQAILTAVQDRELMEFFRVTFVPDEMFFQTLLMNSARRPRVSFRNLRKIRWEGGGWPHIFTEEDFDELKASDAFLARKITLSKSQALIRRIHAHLL
jgi:hypothetical protein